MVMESFFFFFCCCAFSDPKTRIVVFLEILYPHNKSNFSTFFSFNPSYTI